MECEHVIHRRLNGHAAHSSVFSAPSFRKQTVRESKWFQQMGLGLIRPSVSEVQKNVKSVWGCAMQSLCIVICEDLKPEIYRTNLGSCRAAHN